MEAVAAFDFSAGVPEVFPSADFSAGFEAAESGLSPDGLPVEAELCVDPLSRESLR